MLLSELQNKNLLIWGLGKEGLALTQFVQANVKYQNLYLYNDSEIAQSELKIYHGQAIDELLNKVDVIIRSPGVSIYKDEIVQAKAKGVKVTSSSDIFLSEMLKNRPQTTVIGVTGSKGKSTTSSLLYHALQALGKDVALGGNIGRPLIELLPKNHDYVVCELSSYQCSDLSVSPKIVLFTNLFPEHIDWHQNHENYYRDKVHLVAHQQTGDVCFVNDKCDKLKKYCAAYNLPYRYYNKKEGFAEIDNVLCENEKPLLHIEETKLQGFHNLDNMAGVLSVIKYLGLDTNKAVESFKTFNGLPHRLQKVGEKNGILFINDSISTAPETAMAALKSFNVPLGIFLGGYDRAQDYHELAEFINQDKNVKVVVTLFQTGARVAQTLKEVLKRKDIVVLEETNFAEAVSKMYKELQKVGGKMALFSPAAPSYGCFKSFEERGAEFIRLFNNL